MSGISIGKLLPPPLSIQYSLEGSHYVKVILKEERVLLQLLEGEYLHNLFRILMHRRHVSSLPFIYLFIHSSITYISKDSSMFILYFGLSSNMILLFKLF